jgi:MscS family membrane protein
VVLFTALFVSLVVGHSIKGLATWRANLHERRGNRFRSTFQRTIAASAVGVLFLIGLSVGMSSMILEHRVEKFVSVSLHVVFSVVIGYVLFRLVDVAVGMLDELAKRSGSTLNSMLSPIVSTSMRLTIIVLVVLEVVTAISDQPPSAMLAGLGAGGLAIGLAAQETIKNLFGSVMIFADRPFEIGDRIVIDGHDGPVERVGFRSTRIRTLDGHLVTVPNGEMANRTVHNIGKRPYIRRVMNIRVSYDTPPEKVRQALAILRELLAEADFTRDELPPRVFLDDFLETAINIRAIYWFHPADYWAYCDYGEQLNLQVMERFRAAGIRFALPSQRLFLAGDPDQPLPGQSPSL